MADEDDIPDEAPVEDDSVIPDFDALDDDDDIADVLRMMQETRKDD